MVILPENEDKLNVAQSFKALNISGFFTIPELIDRYLKSVGEKGLISKPVIESMLSSMLSENVTSYLKMEEYKQGYVKALADFIYNFQRTSLLDLESAVEKFKTGNLSLKEKDLIKIYAAFEAKLPDYGFDLKSGLVEFTQKTNRENIRCHLGIQANTQIVLCGFRCLTPTEDAFMLTLFQKADRVLFLTCEDAAASGQAVLVRKNIDKLLEQTGNLAVEHQVPPLNPELFFESLSQRIFQPDPDFTQKEITALSQSSGRVLIIEENNRLAEIVSIARQIKRLAETGVSYREIRIVAPEYQLYRQIIGEVFPDYDIPLASEGGIPLIRFPLATLILQMVNQSIGANPYAIREKILASPYTAGFSAEIKPDSLLKYQESSRVEFISGDQLLKSLELNNLYRLDFQFIKNLREKAYRTVKPAPGTSQLQIAKEYLDGLFWESEAEQQAYLVQCAIQFYLLSLAEKTLSAWRAQLSGLEFKEALLGLIRRFGIEENIGFAAGKDRFSIEYRVQERDRVILVQIQSILDELVIDTQAMGKLAGEKIGLAELARIFTRLMTEARLPELVDDGVGIQPVDRGQYHLWNYTFICGMVDGEFPGEEVFNFLCPKKDGLSLGHEFTTVDRLGSALRWFGAAVFFNARRSSIWGICLLF